MPEPDSATDNAVHDPGAAEPQVQMSRTRARKASFRGPAVGPDGNRPGSGAVRSALEVARERWGTPVGPVTVQPWRGGPDSTCATISRDPLAAWQIWSKPSPPMAAIWADLKEGARQQANHGLAWLVPYWLFGIPGFAAACAARVLLDASARPGRFAALLLSVLLFIAGLSMAGIV